MKLDAWLTETGTPDNEFARRIGVSRVTLFRIKTLRRQPKPAVMARIRTETSDLVQPNDFFAPAELQRVAS